MALRALRPRFADLKIASSKHFRVKFFNENVPSFVDRERHLAIPGPRQISLRYKYAHLPQNTLWISVIGATVQGSTLTSQRERIRRRVRQAIWEELRSRGYDRFGRKEGGSLRGTLEVLCQSTECLTLPFDQLRKQAAAVIGELEKQNLYIRDGGNGRRFRKPQG